MILKCRRVKGSAATLPRGRIQRSKSSSQLCVRPVAERAVVSVLATAPRHSFRLRKLHFLRSKFGPFVRTIAEGLAFGAPTCAPEVGAGWQIKNEGGFLTDDGLAHNIEL